jgi:hypothetical protein
MGRLCSICQSPEVVSQVSALVEAGLTVREIQAQVEGLKGFSYHQVGRHIRHSREAANTATSAALTPEELSDQELDDLINEAKSARVFALAQGDAKSLDNSIRTAKGLNIEKRKRIVQAKQAVVAVTATQQSGQIDPSELDAIIARYDAAHGTGPCPTCLGLGSVVLRQES